METNGRTDGAASGLTQPNNASRERVPTRVRGLLAKPTTGCSSPSENPAMAGSSTTSRDGQPSTRLIASSATTAGARS